MFKFFVVAARFFLVFCVCLNFEDLAKQRRKIFGGDSEVGNNDFSVYFCQLCVFFFVFFSLLRSRASDIFTSASRLFLLRNCSVNRSRPPIVGDHHSCLTN